MQFFDKMKEKVKPALTELKGTVEDKIQETKLKSQLRTLQKERTDKLLALGTKVHTLHKGDGIGLEDLTEELAAIDEVDARIAAKQAEIDADEKSD